MLPKPAPNGAMPHPAVVPAQSRTTKFGSRQSDGPCPEISIYCSQWLHVEAGKSKRWSTPSHHKESDCADPSLVSLRARSLSRSVW